MLKTISTFHYQPKPINDTLSYQVFDQFISALDPDRVLFSAEEIATLAKYRLILDEELEKGDCEFIERITEIYERQIYYTDSLLESFRKFDFDLEREESLNLAGPEDFLTKDEIVEMWRKRLKMNTYLSLLEAAEGKPISNESFLNYLPEAIASEKCELFKNGKDKAALSSYIGQQFLYTLAQTFDPHTNYFAQQDLGIFEAELEAESLSFGIIINQNQLGEIVVEDVQPGGSAWDSHQVNEGDVLLKVKIAEEELLPLTCVGDGELMRIFFSNEVKEATFYIRKKSGKVRQVNLTKAVPQLDDQAIQSFVLTGSKKVGYISLPDFYSGEDWVSGCATDVAKELLKLKREGIEGLILDIRNNGGGYMFEAIQLAGLFINYGTLALADEKDGRVSSMKDPNRGTIFNKPLLVLVNAMSASASELFAATIQDHNRGLIIGANTYGKGSMQTILPIDAYKYHTQEMAILGSEASSFVKLTVGKFYRVSGESLQQKGVTPDIPLPTIFDGLKLGEVFEPYSLPNSQVTKKAYFYPSKELPLSQLIENSQQRVSTDSTFQYVEKAGKMLANPKMYVLPLHKDQIVTYWKNGPFASFTADWASQAFSFDISNPEYLKGLSGFLEEGEEVNGETMKTIREDVYVQESYRIMEDLIKAINKP